MLDTNAGCSRFAIGGIPSVRARTKPATRRMPAATLASLGAAGAGEPPTTSIASGMMRAGSAAAQCSSSK